MNLHSRTQGIRKKGKSWREFSEDGKEWKKATGEGSGKHITDIVYGNSKFVGNDDIQTYYSEDGKDWKTATVEGGNTAITNTILIYILSVFHLFRSSDNHYHILCLDH